MVVIHLLTLRELMALEEGEVLAYFTQIIHLLLLEDMQYLRLPPEVQALLD
jgi:hypothetical protein